jgi:N utilization substance protein A
LIVKGIANSLGEVAKDMKSDFIIALTQLAAERNLPRAIVLSAIEAALVSAYKRDSVSAGQNISVKLDPGSGDVSVYVVKTVVEEVEEPLLEISLAEAKKINADAEIDGVVPTESLPHSAGRIAAQTAKQVVIQRLREAERELVFQEFADKEGEVFTVTIQKIEPKHITVELGRADAVLPPSEQAPFERYRVGQRLKVLLQSVRQSNKGPEIIVSRTDKILLKRLFEMEVPEIYNGAVEIMDIAREAGARSKVAVFAKQDGVDAVGSCVGLRGIRIQNIVNELHGEKIDVVQWQKDATQYVARALSPAMVMRVNLNEAERSAVAVVPENQLSLAIGKEGQNARLAARLTGWKVDIMSNVEAEALAAAGLEVGDKTKTAEVPAETVPEDVLEQIPFERLAPELVERPARVPVGVADRSTSIQDLPTTVWNTRNAPATDQGVIRFREDIVELGGPDGPRRGRRSGGGRRAKPKRRR